MKKFFGILISFLILVSCATVRETNRKRIMLISESEEIEMGEKAFSDILSKSKVIKSGKEFDAIERVGRKLASVSGKNYNWEFKLVEDNQVNAFCLPGGKIVFYTGIMPLLENDDEIAVVMSHEIAHAILRHGAERMSQQILVETGANILSVFLEGKSKETQDIFYSAYGFGSAIGILLPYSRKHEFEADYVGLKLMYKAGYDINAALIFWEKMKKLSEKQPKIPNFLSTHPSDEERIEHLQVKIKEILNNYN